MQSGPSITAKQQPVPFKGWDVSALLWHLFPTSVCPKHRQPLFSIPVISWPSTENGKLAYFFGLRTSILHLFGLLPEQMAAAACRSLLVSMKVMLSGIRSSVVGNPGSVLCWKWAETSRLERSLKKCADLHYSTFWTFCRVCRATLSATCDII